MPILRPRIRPVVILAFVAAAFPLACSSSYERFRVGKLEGKLLVQWLEPDKFLFIPDKEEPLRFTRSDGSVIQPGLMVTDGGSIPRPIWILRNYSPWGYAPAFIVHDWLFVMKHCELPGYDRYSHRSAADVMAEVMKTMMETGRAAVDKPTLESMHTAVSSAIAGRLWENGPCARPDMKLSTTQPLAEYELNFDE